MKCVVVILALSTAPCVVAQTSPVAVIQTQVPVDVGRAAFSHDGKFVATIDESGTYTTLWDAKTGQKVVTLSSGRASIINPSGSIASSFGPSSAHALVFSADDRYVAVFDDSKGDSSPPIVWECETGRIVVWKADAENQLKLSIGNWTPTDVRRWSIGPRGKVPALLGGMKGEPRVISKIAVSGDGSKLAVAREIVQCTFRDKYEKQEASIEVWPLRLDQPPTSLATALHCVESLAFSHDAQWLDAATQSKSETGRYTQILVGDVRLWRLSDGVETKLKIENTQAAQDHEWSATNVVFSADDKQVVANVFTPGELPERDCPPDVHCGDLESIPYEVRTNFFDVTSGRAVNSTPLGKSDSSEAEQQGFFWLSSDGRRAIAMQDKLVLVNTLTGREVGAFKPPELRPYPGALDECKSGLHAFGFAAFSNEKQIAVSDGQEIQIVDARTGASSTGNGIYIANDTSDGWLSLAASFSPKGETLGVATCSGFSDDGELLLYNSSNLRKAAGFQADSVLTSLAFTSDGSLLFTGGYDGTVRVVETQHASLVATLFRNISGEWIVFTPSGLYDASADGARLLGWRLKGQIVLASDLQAMRVPGLLSKLVAGERPRSTTTLASAMFAALTRNAR